MNLAGRRDQRVFKIIEERIELVNTQYVKYTKEQEHLRAEQLREYKEFIELCLEESINVARLIPGAIIAICKELELPIDIEAYTSALNERLEMQNATTKSLIEQAVDQDDT